MMERVGDLLLLTDGVLVRRDRLLLLMMARIILTKWRRELGERLELTRACQRRRWVLLMLLLLGDVVVERIAVEICHRRVCL